MIMNKRNENRSGYKETKFGWIPDEWECLKISKLTKIGPQNGLYKLQTEYGGEYEMVHMKDIFSQDIIIENEMKKVCLSENEIMKYSLNEGDLLFARRSIVLEGSGKCSIVGPIKDTITFESSIIRLSLDKSKIYPLFAYYYIASPAGRKQMLHITRSLTISGIAGSDLKTYYLLSPPLPQQKKIAEILSAWDRAIEQFGKLIDAKIKLKKALMQQLLIGKQRFKEFEKDITKSNTRYGEIPSDWSYPKVGEIAEEVSSRNTNNSNIPVLSCTKYDGLVESLKYFGRQVFSKNTSTYKVVKRAQFAYATNHIEEGSIGMLDFLDEGLVSPMYTVFETGDRVYTPFLYKVFKTELYRHIFEVNTSASVNRRGSLRWHGFALIHVPLPSFDEQQKISDCIDAIDREIKLLKKKVVTLKNQKKGMMQKLLTGNIRVKVLIKEMTRHGSSEKRK